MRPGNKKTGKAIKTKGPEEHRGGNKTENRTAAENALK